MSETGTKTDEGEVEQLYCPYCATPLENVESAHLSGAWDSIRAQCPEHDYVEIDVECYKACVDDSPEVNGLECISCNELGHTIPVWEDVTEWFEGEPPDYIGCTNCHTMHSATDQIIEDHYNQ